MGTIVSNGPNLFESNVADPRFTWLSRLGHDFIRRGLIENVYYRTGAGWLEHDGNAIKLLSDVFKVGDYVDLGNVRGFVEHVYEDSDGDVVALVVGVKSDVTEDGAIERKVYLLSQDVESISFVSDHGDLELVDMSEPNLGWSGPVVFRTPTTDKSTWNSIAQAIDRAGYLVDKSVMLSLGIDSDKDSVEELSSTTIQLSYYTVPSESDPESGAVYSLVAPYAGVSIDADTGVVTVADTVVAGSFDVKVELGDFEAVKTIVVTEAE